MSRRDWHRACIEAERERDDALAQLAYEQTQRRKWEADYRAEHADFVAQVEAERDEARARLDAVRELAERWSALAPEDDWADGGLGDTVLADAGRAVLAILDRKESAPADRVREAARVAEERFPAGTAPGYDAFLQGVEWILGISDDWRDGL